MQEARTGRWSDEIERCSFGFQGERCAELHWRAVGGAYLCTAEYVLTPMLGGLPERAGLTLATVYGLCVGPSFSSSVGEQVITTSGNLTYTHA